MSERRSPYENYTLPLPEPDEEGSRKWAAGIIEKFASAKIKFHTTQPA